MELYTELLQFFSAIEALDLQWEDSELFSNLRRGLTGYGHGVWAVALPLQRGPTELPPSLVNDLRALRSRAVERDEVDIGHVIAALDVKFNVSLVDDRFITWAGDLGSHVLAEMRRGREVAVGSMDSLASRADLHGDLDGENISQGVRERGGVEALLNYYDPSSEDSELNVRRRFSLFGQRHSLLDPEAKEGRLRELRVTIRRFVSLEEVAEDAPHPFRWVAEWRRDHDVNALKRLVDTAIDQFLGLIRKGAAAESL